MRSALLGSLWMAGLTAAFCFPIGVATAVYLEEYAPRNRLTSLINLNIFNLAGVLTGQSILLVGMMTEAVVTPFLSDRDLALQNVRYVLNAAGSLAEDFRPAPDGLIVKRAHEPRKGEWSLPGGRVQLGESLVEAARGADLFLAEAAFRECDENPPGIHMTGRQAAEVALKAGVDTLVLTHVPAWHDKNTAVDEASELWSGPMHLAAKGAVYEV